MNLNSASGIRSTVQMIFNRIWNIKNRYTADIWIVLIFIQRTSELVISIYLSGYENRLEKKLTVK